MLYKSRVYLEKGYQHGPPCFADSYEAADTWHTARNSPCSMLRVGTEFRVAAQRELPPQGGGWEGGEGDIFLQWEVV